MRGIRRLARRAPAPLSPFYEELSRQLLTQPVDTKRLRDALGHGTWPSGTRSGRTSRRASSRRSSSPSTSPADASRPGSWPSASASWTTRSTAGSAAPRPAADRPFGLAVGRTAELVGCDAPALRALFLKWTGLRLPDVRATLKETLGHPACNAWLRAEDGELTGDEARAAGAHLRGLHRDAFAADDGAFAALDAQVADAVLGVLALDAGAFAFAEAADFLDSGEEVVAEFGAALRRQPRTEVLGYLRPSLWDEEADCPPGCPTPSPEGGIR